MTVIRRNDRPNDPEVSFVLLDWGCRESFHTLEYLANQVTPRDRYEVIWVEYYDRRPSQLDELIARHERHGLPSPVDTWIIMARPKGEVFRKHWMNNLGFLHSRGDIVVFMDSDAIVSTTIVETIMKEFEDDPDVILYLEEIRTGDKKFYPFCYPSKHEIIPVAGNLANGVPLGMRNFRCGLMADPTLIHSRNYGACFAARRDDLIRYGGWDEHDDYAGYIAGPYEMSLRMEWGGKRERWSFLELLWHTPHPGNDGINNFSGPHDGKGVSTTAMEILKSKRTLPLKENPEIRAIRIKQFGPDAPPPLPQEAVAPRASQPTPTSPVKPDFRWLPQRPASPWNTGTFHLLPKVLMEMETRISDYEYPRTHLIASYAAILAKQLKLRPPQVEEIYAAAMFRSMDNICNAAAAGSDASRNGAGIGQSLADLLNAQPLITAAKVERAKGERFDGTGKEGLRAGQIALEARIVDLAECLDELVNLRGTNKPVSFHEAYRTICEDSGKRFDPKVVDAFKESADDLVSVHLRAQHDTLPLMYPCLQLDSKGNIGTLKFSDFYIASIAADAGPQYVVLPAWDNSKDWIFISSDVEAIMAYVTTHMIMADYYGHNIILCANRFFAVQHEIEDFSLRGFCRGQYGRACLTAKRLPELKRAVIRTRIRKKVRQVSIAPIKRAAKWFVK